MVDVVLLFARGLEVQMALHQKHNEDPFETYDLNKKKQPARLARRKLKGVFSSTCGGGK